VFGSRKFEKRLVPVDADHVSVWSNRLCGARGNGAGAAADIEYRKPWPQPFGKAAVVPLKSSSPEDARIGPV
jgi:hypothetical protein